MNREKIVNWRCKVIRDAALFYLLEGHAKRFLHFDLNHGSLPSQTKFQEDSVFYNLATGTKHIFPTILWLLWTETDLVAANTNTPVKTSMPSNSVRNCKEGNASIRKLIERGWKLGLANKRLTWLTTRSVTPVLSCPLFGAIESNSSKKRRHGAAEFALEKISRTWNHDICISSRTMHYTSLLGSHSTYFQKGLPIKSYKGSSFKFLSSIHIV